MRFHQSVPIREGMLFCLVGGLGFLVDSGVLILTIRNTGLDPYSARLVSFLCAASFTWVLNRRLTFPNASKPLPVHREWALYVSLMAAGGLVNIGTYSLCIAISRTLYSHPVLAVAAGSIAGLALNFASSRSLVFKRQ